MAFKESLDIAEMTNTEGRIGNPAPAGYVAVPDNLALDTPDAIKWSFNAPGDDGVCEKTKIISPPEKLLDEFKDLVDKSPKEILDFAKRFGVLGLNEFGYMPAETEKWDSLERDTETEGWEHLTEWLDSDGCAEAAVSSWGTEPIAEWRSFSLRARSILQLAAALNNKETVKIIDPPLTPLFAPGEGGLPRTRHTVGGGALTWRLGETIRSRFKNAAHIKGRPTSRKENNLIGRDVLDLCLDSWLEHFPTAISVDRVSGELVLVLEYRRGLLSVIALQLLQAVARKSIYLCSECKNPFIRHGGSKLKRRPKTGMDRFCDPCGKDGTKAALRRADTRRREKQRQAKALYAAGGTVKEIALKLGVAKISTVSGWVGKRT
jgi:hypothetical protein